MSLDRLWAGWRSSYVDNVANADSADGGCIFCSLQDRDDEVVAREPHAFAILNRYPYTSGHLLVAPTRHTGDLEALSADEAAALMRMTQHATAAVKAAYQPDGVNVGMNLGRAAGAGIPCHLHVHVLPRWVADTNFLTSVAEARVLPEPLDVSREKLAAAWPS